jgi:flagellar biosynthesis chaperone FliJ
MARDRLKTLSVVRQHAVDQRRQALAACLRAEAAAEERILMLDEALHRDQALAETLPDQMLFRDIFLATRQHLQAEQQVTRTVLADAGQQTDEARTGLASARLAAEAVERLIAERASAARAEADLRAQHVLDDIARGLRK